MIPMAVTVIVALVSNMFFGFLAGIIIHYLLLQFYKCKKE
jgi:tetrahydromethanopterin S-methyltransferase subunit B